MKLAVVSALLLLQAPNTWATTASPQPQWPLQPQPSLKRPRALAAEPIASPMASRPLKRARHGDAAMPPLPPPSQQPAAQAVNVEMRGLKRPRGSADEPAADPSAASSRTKRARREDVITTPLTQEAAPQLM